MHLKPTLTVLYISFLFISQSIALSIPPNLRTFYNTVKNAGACTGPDLLKGGFYCDDHGPRKYGYCKKHMKGHGFYLKGPKKELVNMDIDCDGHQTAGDGRCSGSDDTQGQTAFKHEVKKLGIPDLNTYIHPYVVLGNEGNYNPTFDPREHGIRPLSVVAVVCGEKLVYGIWGDTNGDDGKPLVGEASLALATECFGKEMNANNGHDEKDVLYIAFAGEKAVPGKSAKWDAKNYKEFEKSIAELGDTLVAGLKI